MITIKQLADGSYQLVDNHSCFTGFRIQMCFGELLIDITDVSDIYTASRHIVGGYSGILKLFCGKRIILHYAGQYCPVLASDSALNVYERYKLCYSNR